MEARTRAITTASPAHPRGWRGPAGTAAAVAAAGFLGALTGSAWATMLLCAAAAGFCCTLWWRARRRRRRETALLEERIRGALVAPLPAARGALGFSERLEDPGLANLALAINALTEFLADQTKEAARRGRNLEALIDALTEPVLATDDEDAVLLCNRAAEEMLESKPGELIGQPIRALFTHPRVLELQRRARAGKTLQARVELTTRLGQRVFEATASPVPVAWGQGVFGAVIVLRDVTELAQSVRVKTDFVANASHELRTPVAAIRSAAETLEEVLEEDPEMCRRLIGMIDGQAARLEEMTRDLLDLSRVESMEGVAAPEDIDVLATVEAVAGQFKEACDAKRLRVEIDVAPGAERLRTDRRLLTLVLRNLVENAVKFAYEQTAVTIKCSETRDESAGRRVRFEITDRGVGIPLHLQERVFERFFQVDAARTMRKGSGLGLAIVKHAVRQLGGELGLESVWREGTTVWFEAPDSAGAETGHAEDERAA